MIITRVFLFNLWSIRPEKIVCPRLIVLGIMQCASIVCNVDTHAMCCKMHMFVPINRLNLAPLFPRSNSTAFQTNLRPMSMHTGTLQVGTENDFLHTSTTSTFWTYACAKWAHSNSLYSYCYYCNSFIIIAACMNESVTYAADHRIAMLLWQREHCNRTLMHGGANNRNEWTQRPPTRIAHASKLDNPTT